MYQEFDDEKNSNLLFYSLAIFFIIFSIWLNISKLDIRVKGSGTVIPSIKKQIIEATNTGTIVEIYKKEGDTLKKDEAIMLIDPTSFKASKQQVKDELASLQIKLERFENESKEDFLNLENLPSNDKKDKLYINENETFKVNQKSIIQKINTISNKIKPKIKEINANKAKIKKLNNQISVTSKQIKMITKLVAKGAYSKVELLNLKSKLVEFIGDKEITKENIEKIVADIEVIKSSKEEIIKSFNAKASQKLNELKSKISKLKEQLKIESNKVTKTIIKSPVDGYLNRTYINSLNEVVRAGDKIAEVVPTNSSLIINTKISPSDIAFIKPDLNATIKLTAYDYNIYGYLHGKIIEISSDVFIDEKDESKSYYLLKIKTDKSYLKFNDKKLKIIPGMIADVDILVGKRTLFDYIFSPIQKALNNAGHEK